MGIFVYLTYNIIYYLTRKTLAYYFYLYILCISEVNQSDVNTYDRNYDRRRISLQI
jgi:hypothetical protein